MRYTLFDTYEILSLYYPNFEKPLTESIFDNMENIQSKTKSLYN